MKTKVLVLFMGLFALLFFTAQNVAAQGAFSYSAGIQVQNLEADTATIVITFYNQSGTVDATVNNTISANGSATFFPLSVSSGFNGSAVVSSDRQVASIVNVLGDNGAAAASYVGKSAGSTTVQLPLLMKDNSGFNTWFNVQNTSASNPATVNVAYSDGTTAGPVTIQPGASQTFFQANETHSQAVFSAVITSDEPVVASVIEESSSVMFAYTGFTGGSTEPVFPLINANNSGYITGIQIQNLGGTATDVTVSYTPSSAGTACTETQTVPANGSATFALAAFASTNSGEDCADGATFVGSAQVTANSASQDLAAIINQLRPGLNGEAYGSFDPAEATDTVVLPLIMDRNFGYFTGFNVAHVGGPDATVTCTFTGTSYTVSDTLSAGEALTDLQNGKIADTYVGSATCTADNASTQIVAIVNELGASASADQLLVYEGVSK